MFEILGGGIFGSLLGGIFRLAPEVLKYFDKKNERQHELAMFDKQCVQGQIDSMINPPVSPQNTPLPWASAA